MIHSYPVLGIDRAISIKNQPISVTVEYSPSTVRVTANCSAEQVDIFSEKSIVTAEFTWEQLSEIRKNLPQSSKRSS